MSEDYASAIGEIDDLVLALGALTPDDALEIRSTARFPGGHDMSDYDAWTDSDAWLSHYASSFSSDNEHFPYVLSGLQLTTRNNFRFCSDISVRFSGASLGFESEYGKLTRQYNQVGRRRITVATELKLPRSVHTES